MLYKQLVDRLCTLHIIQYASFDDKHTREARSLPSQSCATVGAEEASDFIARVCSLGELLGLAGSPFEGVLFDDDVSAVD